MHRYLITYNAHRNGKDYEFKVGIVADSEEQAIQVIARDCKRLEATFEVTSVEVIE